MAPNYSVRLYVSNHNRIKDEIFLNNLPGNFIYKTVFLFCAENSPATSFCRIRTATKYNGWYNVSWFHIDIIHKQLNITVMLWLLVLILSKIVENFRKTFTNSQNNSCVFKLRSTDGNIFNYSNEHDLNTPLCILRVWEISHCMKKKCFIIRNCHRTCEAGDNTQSLESSSECGPIKPTFLPTAG